MISYEEFERKYCSTCGTQRCEGVNDEEWRAGCLCYVQEYHTARDMSSACGMHYEKYWHAVHVEKTMSQEDFDKWLRGNCYQCKHMSEICMKD